MNAAANMVIAVPHLNIVVLDAEVDLVPVLLLLLLHLLLLLLRALVGVPVMNAAAAAADR